MDAILDELDGVTVEAEAERQRGATPAAAARAWERFLRERGGSETPRPLHVRWRDAEGL